MADTPKPVLKWAGGKRQLINTIDENLPLELKEGHSKIGLLLLSNLFK